MSRQESSLTAMTPSRASGERNKSDIRARVKGRACEKSSYTAGHDMDGVKSIHE